MLAVTAISSFNGCIDGGNVGAETTGGVVDHPPSDISDDNDLTNEAPVPDHGDGGNLNGSGH